MFFVRIGLFMFVWLLNIVLKVKKYVMIVVIYNLKRLYFNILKIDLRGIGY